jgi:ankyrin repeat protein
MRTYVVGLMHAASTGKLSVIKLLLENWADPGLKDFMRKTALDYAREEGNEEIVIILQNIRK